MNRLFAQSLIASGLLGLLAASPAAANIVRTDNVEAELVADSVSIAPGQSFYVALRQTMQPDWHTYWKNPGDSGEATAIDLTLPDGWTAEDIVWPAPERIPVGPLVNYGYSDEILLPVRITPPANLDTDQVTLAAHATWLVCNDICIPEDGEFTLDLLVTQTPRAHPEWSGAIAETLAGAPGVSDARATLARTANETGNGTIRLHVADAALGDPDATRNVYFFSDEAGTVEPAAPQPAAFHGADGVALDLTPGFLLREDIRPLGGVLAFEARSDGGWTPRAIQIAASPGDLPALGAPLAVSSGAGGDSGGAGGAQLGLLAAIGAAFLGGLILNLMPCVFPVLSLKALTFAERAHLHAREVRRDGLMFLAGVLVSFTVLAVVLIGVRAAGGAAGWGFQLQTPGVVAALALLFFAISLNLIGAFEFGGRLQNVGSSLAEKKGPAGAFFVGVLAVIVATPCTAPFMAAALGYALVQPAYVSLAIFLSLGLGLAAPFVALAFTPALLRRLPKPGPWMVKARQLLAFPMAATAIWLVWVLSLLAGADAVAAVLLAMLGVAFAVWAFGAFRRAGAVLGALGLLLAAGGIVLAATAEGPADGAVYAGGSELESEPWSTERVNALLAEGRPVFVDFTAAWCVTCQVNERTTLSAGRVLEAFADNNAVYMVADWTARDAAIEAELAKYGRSGVPLYLVFSPSGGEPVILPQILTEGRVVSALEDALG